MTSLIYFMENWPSNRFYNRINTEYSKDVNVSFDNTEVRKLL